MFVAAGLPRGLTAFVAVLLAAAHSSAAAPNEAVRVSTSALESQLEAILAQQPHTRRLKTRSSVWTPLAVDDPAGPLSNEGFAVIEPCGKEKESPWLMMQCWARHGPISLLRLDSFRPAHGDTGNDFGFENLVGLAIFVTAMIFAIYSIRDLHRFVMLLKRHYAERNAGAGSPTNHNTAVQEHSKVDNIDSKAHDDGEASKVGYYQRKWSIPAIICLTSYRFYTGFLSATWLPYLLAMEGQDLWQEKQAMFMGVAKLIYGGTILLNPIFGLVGDQAVNLSHGVGRRMFVRIGITTAAVGIYICVLAGQQHAFLSFLSGILVWRLGEATNDVTTEALIPEMVPQEQYQVGAAIKASSFLLGGLFGYALLLIFAEAHYSWLYYAYPIGMFLCSLPSLLLLDQDDPLHVLRAIPSRDESEEDDQEGDHFIKSLMQAYITPLGYPGGFPLACLAVFTFSLGTAPMFFLLLIVRDIVGVTDPVMQQQQFSASSIMFFLSAALTSAASALGGGGRPARSSVHDAGDEDAIKTRGYYLVVSMIAFGGVVLVIPTLAAISDPQARDTAFYILTVIFGGAFGVSFSLFQDLIWLFLPENVNTANAMGFSVMSRLLGVGLGNFFAGGILDLFYAGDGLRQYAVGGYVVLCCASGAAVLGSAVLAHAAVKMGSEAPLRLAQAAVAQPPSPAAAA